MKTRFRPLWAAGAAAATLVLSFPMLSASPACGEDSYGDAVEETAPDRVIVNKGEDRPAKSRRR
mgnify:CR=1 FL=1